MKYAIKTEGMGCAHCIKRVTDAMNALNAAPEKVELNDIVVDFDGEASELRTAIEDLGFDVVNLEKA